MPKPTAGLKASAIHAPVPAVILSPLAGSFINSFINSASAGNVQWGTRYLLGDTARVDIVLLAVKSKGGLASCSPTLGFVVPSLSRSRELFWGGHRCEQCELCAGLASCGHLGRAGLITRAESPTAGRS